MIACDGPVTDGRLLPESLSVPVEEEKASGHQTAGDDKSVSPKDIPQSEEPLDAKVERWAELHFTWMPLTDIGLRVCLKLNLNVLMVPVF